MKYYAYCFLDTICEVLWKDKGKNMRHILRYNKPASNWDEALPIGNGKLGAMIYGNSTGYFQLNEDSVWYGNHTNRNNPKALPNLNKVRKLILDGKITEAEEILKDSFSGIPQSCRYYQTLGDFNLNLKINSQNITDYTRYLDIDNAISGYSFKTEDILYTVETFSSCIKNCIIIHLYADKKNAISFSPSLSRDYYDEDINENTNMSSADKYCVTVNNDSVTVNGRLGKDGLIFASRAFIQAKNADIYLENNQINICDADEATIYITGGTNFRYPDLINTLIEFTDKASKMTYDALINEHIDEYHSLYNTNSLELGTNINNLQNLTTDVLLGNPEKYGNELTEIYYSYGRYLLISSSRKGSNPANLQGIWNKDMTPPWGSKYTININAQMNYWPSEICNLSDCHLPLFDLLKRMVPNGRITAKSMYNCKGFVAHHNTDIWGDTAPVDIWVPGTYWVMGGAWLSTHIWMHYIYTEDTEFLQEYYPIMKESAEFFFDFLIEHNGYLMTCPSVSPENTFILPNGNKGANGIGCTMDNQILYDLLTECIKASDILNITDNDSFISKAKETLSKIKPNSIDSNGRLMEWNSEYEEDEPGHRHISHLYGLHPSDQITIDKTPELANAARASLEYRLRHGGGHTGWSKAWIINHYAKLWDGDNAYKNLIELFKNSTLPNMLDNHPPFQIDGNFGATAGIAHMLLQSNEERLVLLPALPKALPQGKCKGLKAVGNLEVSIEWKNCRLTKAVINSKKDKNIVIKYQNKNYEIHLYSGENELHEF